MRTHTAWPLAFASNVILVLSLSFGAVGCVMTQTHANSPPETQAVAPVQVSTQTPLPSSADDGWSVFRDPDAQCSIRYPADAHFQRGTDKFGVVTMRLQFSIPDAEGHQGMVIRAIPRAESDSLETLLPQIYESGAHEESYEEWKSRLQETSINDVPAWRTYCSQEGGDFAVIISQQDRVYVASLSHDQAATCSDPRAVELFYRVLATLSLDMSGASGQ